MMDDPRSYYSVLGGLDYMIPDVAEPVIRQVLAAKASVGDKPTVLDIGCSYGINAAVHRFPLSFDTLRRRYARRELVELSSDDLLRLDAHFFAAWPDRGLANFIGLDISEPAIRYAKRVGLIADGVVADLEENDLTPEAARIISRADVILSTGCIGYLGETTFRKLLASMDRRPWVVSFVLRMFPFEGVAQALNEHGYVTERLDGATFIQRRFRNCDEFEHTLQTLAALGKDTHGLETEGLYHADLYISRPAEDAMELPLCEFVTIASGRHRSFGPRYVQVETDEGTLVTLEP
ncbi:MAG: class I SAM-dependent methyltransferase [Methylocystis sp.]|uniref:class I SAM-dependent methyltransferase n=1 Tax=Methylocystis sp. TaxID=1911079 RepID=UPI003D0C2DC4